MFSKKIFFLLLLIFLPKFTAHAFGWKAVTIASLTAVTFNYYLKRKKEHKRYDYNQDQLQQLAQQVKQGKQVVLVSDLHKVILDRLSTWGDFKRVAQLPPSELGNFLKNIVPFLTRYISHKLRGYPAHPAVEQYVLDHVTDKEKRERIIQLICPFELSTTMYDLYKNHCPFPKFACSNSGKSSYEWLNAKSNGKLDTLFLDKQISTPENGRLQKDQTENFETLFEKMKNAGINPQAILMVDDKVKNIKKCDEVLSKKGITAYGYIFKNASEFEADLKTFGLYAY